jgi:hypothetical protein
MLYVVPFNNTSRVFINSIIGSERFITLNIAIHAFVTYTPENRMLALLSKSFASRFETCPKRRHSHTSPATRSKPPFDAIWRIS